MGIEEDDVVEYLRQHPKFFTQHEDLLALMEIPHQRGAAVSLVEKQLGVLREENQRLQHQLEELINIAQKNQELNHRIQQLIAALSGAQSISEFFDVLYETINKEFHTDACVVRLFASPRADLNERLEFVEYDAQVFSLFENLLSNNRAICGRLSDAQRNYLFPKIKIASAVLIPLGVPKPNGILALGSRDVARFHAGMATDLLKYMGELISHLMTIWLN